MMDWSFIPADWPAPANVRAMSTTRAGGVSEGAWSSLNLGERCHDDPRNVMRNRERLGRHLPSAPRWLRQVHGTGVVNRSAAAGPEDEADGVVCFQPGQVCAVLTADCLPVFFCDRSGDRVAVAHAGWRGLAAGILGATVRALEVPPADLLAWLGPAIGPDAYEVGEDVAEAFPDEFRQGFRARGGRYLMDIYAVARLKLAACGVEAVYGGGLCTFTDAERFFSYRRDGRTGRMAHLIWREY